MDIKTMVIKAQKGDAEAMGQMYEIFAPKMRMTCAKLLRKQTPVIDDLVHDSFILAYTSINKLKNPEKLGIWLQTIIHNVTIRYIEAQEAKKTQQLSSIKEDSKIFLANSQSSDSQTLTKEILDSINELPNGYRNILHLHIFKGYSHQEIGEIMGIAAHSSSSQLSRAKSALQRIMRERNLWYVLLLSLIIAPIYKLFFEKKQVEKHNIVTLRKSRGNNKHQYNTEMENCNNTKEKSSTFANKKTEIIDANYTNIQDSIYNVCNDTTCPKEVIDKNVFKGNTISDMHVITSINTDSCSNIEQKDYQKNRTKQHKWNIACSGILSNSVNEDKIGTMISTASNTASNVMQEFNNWEAYTEDLLINNPIPDKKIKTLMNIATNNSGDIIEHEKHQSPITFGVALSKQVTNYWNIETGLQYTLLRSTLSIGNNGYSIEKEQKLYYLGIPLRVAYKILDYKDMSAFASTGITINLPIYGKVKEIYIEDYKPIPSEKWHLSAPWQVVLNSSICLQYKFTKRLGLYIEPTLNYNIPNGSDIHSVWTEHPFMFTMPLGLRLVW